MIFQKLRRCLRAAVFFFYGRIVEIFSAFSVHFSRKKRKICRSSKNYVVHPKVVVFCGGAFHNGRMVGCAAERTWFPLEAEFAG